ncbi:undecaprenyl/decaprenyl-phosphate alpha-N-acetylglucosaminyl 1-phosphate transferase [Patescibacteria group bacterium]|nr:undecaprenyl/decaprenyl-phosphate alpha-N-acetylglucosaminyl 1-phosphate transferase [Patescibacteria group bacterium]
MLALLFIIAFTLAFFITPTVIRIYLKHNWVDDPKTNKHAKVTHKNAVPRGGGLVIFGAVFLAALLFLQIDKHLIGILLGAFILTVVGTLDDIYDLNPKIRIFTGLAAALAVVGSGIGIAYVTNPFGPGVIHFDQPQLIFNLLGEERSIWILSDLLAVFFILWNMNIVNWSKGVDGQMPGFVAIAAAFIGILALRFAGDPSQLQTAELAFIVSGAFAGFLIWNFYPQRIMSGYGAGSLAGFFLAVLAILSGAKFATTVMVLAVPTADAIFTITRRLLAGKSPLWGDRGHLHHKLLDVFGWGRKRIAIFYWVTSFSLGVLSLVLDTRGKILAILAASATVFFLLVWAKLRYTHKQRVV